MALKNVSNTSDEVVTDKFFVKYTSPAYPPEGILVQTEYICGKDAVGTYLESNGVKIYKDKSFIMALFTPIKGDWKEF